MEKLIKDIYWANARGTVSVKNNKYKVHLIKYVDNFVVTASNKETLEVIKEMLKTFLLERGLILSKGKTKITHIQEGKLKKGLNVILTSSVSGLRINAGLNATFLLNILSFIIYNKAKALINFSFFVCKISNWSMPCKTKFHLLLKFI